MNEIVLRRSGKAHHAATYSVRVSPSAIKWSVSAVPESPQVISDSYTRSKFYLERNGEKGMEINAANEGKSESDSQSDGAYSLGDGQIDDNQKKTKTGPLVRSRRD
jgi:hypothetical protein